MKNLHIIKAHCKFELKFQLSIRRFLISLIFGVLPAIIYSILINQQDRWNEIYFSNINYQTSEIIVGLSSIYCVWFILYPIILQLKYYTEIISRDLDSRFFFIYYSYPINRKILYLVRIIILLFINSVMTLISLFLSSFIVCLILVPNSLLVFIGIINGLLIIWLMCGVFFFFVIGLSTFINLFLNQQKTTYIIMLLLIFFTFLITLLKSLLFSPPNKYTFYDLGFYYFDPIGFYKIGLKYLLNSYNPIVSSNTFDIFNLLFDPNHISDSTLNLYSNLNPFFALCYLIVSPVIMIVISVHFAEKKKIEVEI